MDMKKILEKLDSQAKKPVANSDDMKKYLQVITEASDPHRVSLPVRMAMEQYQKTEPVQPKKSVLQQYVNQVIAENEETKQLRRQEINQRAKMIADRIMENTIPGHSAGFTGGVGPGIQSSTPDSGHLSLSEDNPKDIIKMDVPLLIRLLEYAREDAKTDMDLHNVTEKLIDLSESGDILTMDHYDAIVGTQPLLPNPEK